MMDSVFNYNTHLHVPNFTDHIRHWQDWSAAALAKHPPILQGKSYGNCVVETLDFFSCGRDQAPLLVFIHGGYWKSRERSEFAWVASRFVEQGVSVAVLDYGLAPDYYLEQMYDQVVRAHIWLHDNAEELGIDRRRIITAGHSAGAHLAVMMALTYGQHHRGDLPSALTSAVFATSGVYDLRPLVTLPFLGDLRLDCESAVRNSPILSRPNPEIPIHLSYGTNESEAFVWQTQNLADAWPEYIASLLPLEGRNHFEACDAFKENGSLVQAILRHCSDMANYPSAPLQVNL
ncbi:arylformamidase [Pseudaminobacter salicylatoxidans]|uniref:Arylformamidase n=1 Tax=Pseudaminobacter salicylatoxidans TaxID=93369 RepID=A0A316C195_PSESE|nr:alpha/beta hydrolase [Pseudaminobacter salicylatoxidans]PWJ82334.1 arylformamidase [Pseudaminobacter salicylatoxidans]